jgi:N-acetylmuramoyl-L-alanine amidase
VFSPDWPQAAAHPSPNHGPRRNGLLPRFVVLHYTGMRDGAAALDRLCCVDAQVSAHYVIDLDGKALQLVPEDRRAWHAGAGTWLGLDDLNSRSIGVELVNRGDRPFPAAQMWALSGLLGHLQGRWGIAPYDVIGHSDMAPDRKEDPGPRFDWRSLALQRLTLHPDGLGPELPLGRSLDSIGYPSAPDDKRLQAFRFRFAPWLQGPESAAVRRRAACVADGFAQARAQ